MATKINREKLRQQINVFNTVASSKKIYGTTKKFTNSQGTAIAGINECFSEFDKYCQAINVLYGATGTYLHTVALNYDNAEKDNMKK